MDVVSSPLVPLVVSAPVVLVGSSTLVEPDELPPTDVVPTLSDPPDVVDAGEVSLSSEGPGDGHPATRQSNSTDDRDNQQFMHAWQRAAQQMSTVVTASRSQRDARATSAAIVVTRRPPE
ncbi:hypothetical protein [Nannocystis radixulma]|uniref:Secreted protein n=1 Tax=Nannocystis radixulma TaxID=2995305 RepID=A0ABT5AZZ1_9BACT|nr:hypothetical protein [Nannocystis radixulma]MDC0666854.1 hypothetical protein [Nannocystis radixulma]